MKKLLLGRELLGSSFLKMKKLLLGRELLMSWLPASSGQVQYMLKFGTLERQRINMGSNLYVMFSHHLSRQFTGADKLVVSTMAALHYCLKFHRYAFSRHQLFRMTEMMSIYSSPELNNIFEATITQSLWPYLRVIRSGISRYRFFSWIEQEIRYIARINDLESASYTFSLDAINDIKAHYRKTLNGIRKTYRETSDIAHERGPSLISEINIVLGDIYFLERAYDEAVVYYQTAVISHHNPMHGREGAYDLDCLLRYVEALLKLGNVQEYRQRFDRAAMNYQKARLLVDSFLIQLKNTENNSASCKYTFNSSTTHNNEILRRIESGDSKWILLKQPYWAEKFLDLKKGFVGVFDENPPETLYARDDPHGQFRMGQFYFFMHQHKKASKAFINTLTLIKKLKEKDKGLNLNNSEFLAYLSATACVNLVENFLIQKTNNLTKSLFEKEGWKAQEETIIDCIKICVNVGESTEKLISTEDLKSLSDAGIDDFSYTGIIALDILRYAAEQYKQYKLYDHASITYLKIIALWTVLFDMVPSGNSSEALNRVVLLKNKN